MQAAVLQHAGQRVLAIETAQGETAHVQETLCQTLAWAQLDAILVLDHIPMDKRHNAKVDYPALRQAVQRALA